MSHPNILYTSVLVDLIVYQAILIRIFLKGYNKLCSPLLRLLDVRRFSVKINKILTPVNMKVDDFLNKITQT